jgi:multiple sugar transport system substrate-binding protein
MKLNRLLAGVSVAASLATGAIAQELVVWHDLGDNGIAWFEAMGEEFAKEHPGVTVTSVSYPTDQWFGRVIGAINTDTAPDLIYNNYERVIRIENQTERLTDMSGALGEVEDKDFLTDADLQVATYGDKMIILPIQRVQMGFGARKSWLDAIGAEMPTTWEEAMTVAEKFGSMDPDGNGNDDTFGFALEAANPRDLIHMLVSSPLARASSTL